MLAINFSPFHNLESERLLLRRLATADVDELFKMRSNADMMKFIPRPLHETTADTLEQIALINSRIESNEAINWAITRKNNPKLIGIIGFYRMKPEHFRAEIGYMLLNEYQGKGISTEAINEVVKYGFEVMKLHSIEAVIDPRNIASEKVLQKNGFIKEGHFKECEFFDGHFLDQVIYSKLNHK